MKARQIAEEMEGFRQSVSEMLATWNVPGVAIAIVKDGETVLAEGFGLRDVGKGLPVTPKTLFGIGSCTKAFTATAMGILVDEGKLDWDRRVRDYIPTFTMHDAFAGDHMTPRDLVCHCSGLPGHDFVWLNAACTRQELLERLQYLEPNKDFRAVYQYQNLMFMAPGCLVGQISQSSWEAFVQERILDPLGMVRTNLSVRTSQTSEDVALPYHEREGEVNEVPFRNIDAIGPAGSINSCVTDMAQWLVLNLNKGKHGDQQIISEGTLSEIHSPQMVIREALKHPELLHSSYGLGWIVQPYRGHRLIRHGGRIDGFSALTSFMPHDNIGVVALSNRDIAGTPLPTILTYQVYDRLLGLDLIPWSDRLKKEHDEAKEAAQKAKERAVAERKSGTGLTHPLADYIGDFEHPGYGVVSVEVADGGLKATFHDMAFPLEHYHYDIFEMVSDLFDTRMTVSFISDVKGEISRLSIPLEPSVKDIIFTRMQDKS